MRYLDKGLTDSVISDHRPPGHRRTTKTFFQFLGHLLKCFLHQVAAFGILINVLDH